MRYLLAVFAAATGLSLAFLTWECSVLGVHLQRFSGLLAGYAVCIAIAALSHRVDFRLLRNGSFCVSALVLGAVLHPTIEHLCLRFDRPLISTSLADVDTSLGLDWIGYRSAIRATPALHWATYHAYNTFGLLVMTFPFYLTVLGDTRRLLKYFAIMATSLVLVDICFTLWPSVTASTVWGVDDPLPNAWSHAVLAYAADRAGTYDALADLSGLVSFPSFHTAGTLIMIWVSVGTWAFPVLATVGAGILLAVPAWGGHYFVDVPGGVLIAAVSIALVEAPRLRSRSAGGRVSRDIA